MAERNQQRKIFGGKKERKSRVYVSKKAQEKRFSELESSDSKNFIFKLAKRIKCENQDIVGDNDSAKLTAWKKTLCKTTKC